MVDPVQISYSLFNIIVYGIYFKDKCKEKNKNINHKVSGFKDIYIPLVSRFLQLIIHTYRLKHNRLYTEQLYYKEGVRLN